MRVPVGLRTRGIGRWLVVADWRRQQGRKLGGVGRLKGIVCGQNKRWICTNLHFHNKL
jgi:hypothetical protein